MKYHLGCGSQYLQGYLNVDFPPENHTVNNDVKADLYTDILNMEYEECDEIRSSHFFEHFNYYNSFVLLYKWTNALKLNGKLIIDVPDLEALCQAYLNANAETKFLVLRYIAGSHEAAWSYHINGWSKDTLSFVLTELGYKITEINKYGIINSKQPNCGICITALLDKKIDREILIDKLSNILKKYQNGNTDFENRLGQYFINEMKKKI